MDNDCKKESRYSCYACPMCKQPLTPMINGLYCLKDGVEYPVKNGIPDFILKNLTENTNPVWWSVDKVDNINKIFETLAERGYEGPSIYGIVDTVHEELGIPSMEEMAKMTVKMVDLNNGVGLDVPCGTGFVTRHLARKMPLVYGIDISMGMLEKAIEYAREGGIGNIRFARSMAERLPFPGGIFDGVTCSEGLHLFQDPAEALSEMARVMKSGAQLAASTLVTEGLSDLKKIAERVAPHNRLDAETEDILHIFDVDELDNYLSQTGFTGFTHNIYGPYILFHAEKG